MLKSYIEQLTSIYKILASSVELENKMKKEVFTKSNIMVFLAGFDHTCLDILNKIKIITNRLDGTITDLNSNKLNKNDVNYFSLQIDYFNEFRRILRADFNAINLLLGREKIDLYRDTLLDDVFGEIKNLMNSACEIAIILSEIKTNFTRFENDDYYSFEVQEKIKPSVTIEIGMPDTPLIEISRILVFDKINSLFICGKNGTEYRLASPERTKFMDILLNEGANGNYVNYETFAEGLSLPRFDDGGGRYGSRLPPRTKEKIRELYKAMRRSLETALEITEQESDFCGGANGGYRLLSLKQ